MCHVKVPFEKAVVSDVRLRDIMTDSQLLKLTLDALAFWLLTGMRVIRIGAERRL